MGFGYIMTYIVVLFLLYVAASIFLALWGLHIWEIGLQGRRYAGREPWELLRDAKSCIGISSVMTAMLTFLLIIFLYPLGFSATIFESVWAFSVYRRGKSGHGYRFLSAWDLERAGFRALEYGLSTLVFGSLFAWLAASVLG